MQSPVVPGNTAFAGSRGVANSVHAGPVLHDRLPADVVPDSEVERSSNPLPGAKRDHAAGSGNATATGRSGEPTPDRSGVQDKFTPDIDTRKPDILPYREVFEPSIAPFKRLNVFDKVDENGTLSVADAATVPLERGGAQLNPSREERFVASIPLTLARGVTQRIPSVGPGCRVLYARALANDVNSPPGVRTDAREVPVTLVRDSVGQWYVASEESGALTLRLELAMPRAAFGGDYGQTDYLALPAVVPLPRALKAAAGLVHEKLNVSRSRSPRDNIETLVAHFRSFEATDTLVLEGTADVYTALALRKKGVCRHRAYAFMITAVGLGIPTRVVTNEAHAWVEVHNGTMWKRIDLGGAGGELASDPGDVYDSPPDPFAWPRGAERGDDLARRAGTASKSADAGSPERLVAGATGGGASREGLAGQGSARAAADSPPGANATGERSRGDEATGQVGDTAEGARRGNHDLFAPQATAVVPSRVPDPLQSIDALAADARGVAIVTLGPIAKLVRGDMAMLDGSVVQNGTGCAGLSVSIVLMPLVAPGAKTARKAHMVGTLATDANGRFHQELRVPVQLPSGEYDLVGYTLGDARCGRGVSR
jgi:transglutaminase-like putative cysteine protease